MKVNVKLCKGAYLLNCTPIELIMRVRKSNKAEDNYDLLEVECNNWKEIRMVYFNGAIAIPEELEDNEIQMWKVEQLSNSYNDISIDIKNIKETLKQKFDETNTIEIQRIIYDMQQDFDIKANEIINSM